MPAKDFLDLEEKKNLQKALKEEERAEVRERILMFLLLNDGKTQREIAEFIGCSRLGTEVVSGGEPEVA